MAQVTETKDPLAPDILCRAGVSVEDAIWIRLETPEHERIRALLTTPRGGSIVRRVRQLWEQSTSPASMATA